MNKRADFYSGCETWWNVSQGKERNEKTTPTKGSSLLSEEVPTTTIRDVRGCGGLIMLLKALREAPVSAQGIIKIGEAYTSTRIRPPIQRYPPLAGFFMKNRFVKQTKGATVTEVEEIMCYACFGLVR